MRNLPVGLYVCYITIVGTSLAGAQVSIDEPIQRHLDAKEFDLALQEVEARENDRDHLLGRIALAQASAGEVSASKDTLRRIMDVGTLTATARQVRSQAAGGATGADFDTLINLITSTVSPDSWDDVGGPGAIAEFPGGVYVDSEGVLQRAQRVTNAKRKELNLLRDESRDNLADGDPRRTSDLRMISLTRLERELKLRAAFGEPATEAMKHLAGIREIRYLFLFPETRDCVIAGPAGDWLSDEDGVVADDDPPAVLLDDLVTLLNNAKNASGRFGCSITPKRENLAATKRFLAVPTGTLKPHQTQRWVDEIRDTLGLQNIGIHGIDPRSHVARVLIEADYHMKLVGMGLEPSVPDVPSYLESIEADEIPETMDALRWWFTLRKDVVRRNDEGDAFVFASQSVRLRSENEQITKDGDRVHTGAATALNQQFAARFTRHFDRLAKQYPVYAKLESLFRLSIVASLLQTEEIQSRIDWDPSWLVSALSTAEGVAPKEVPSIVNHRTIDRRRVVVGVSGGVVVDAAHAIASIRRAKNDGDFGSDRNTAHPRSPRDSERWWWD